MKLDLDKPHGTVYGTPDPTKPGKVVPSYEQNGVLYGPEGEELEKWSTPEKIAAEAKQAEARKAKEAALALKREQREIRRKILEET